MKNACAAAGAGAGTGPATRGAGARGGAVTTAMSSEFANFVTVTRHWSTLGYALSDEGAAQRCRMLWDGKDACTMTFTLVTRIVSVWGCQIKAGKCGDGPKDMRTPANEDSDTGALQVVVSWLAK